MADAGRLLHVAVTIGRDIFHVVVVYGYTNAERDRSQRELNEALLREAVGIVAELGNAPAVLCGDLNTSIQGSLALASNIEAGVLHDFASLQAVATGTDVQATCFPQENSRGTCIDHILGNSIATHAFAGFSQVVSGVPTHTHKLDPRWGTPRRGR